MLNQITQNAVREVLSKKLGKNISIQTCEEVGGGYHSYGYKVTTDNGVFFVKQNKSLAYGLETFPSKFSSYATSFMAASAAQAVPEPLALISVTNDQASEVLFDENSSEVVAVYSYLELGDDLKTLLKDINENSLEKGKEYFDQVAHFLAELHKKPLTIDGEKKAALYKASLKSMIGHPELSLTVLFDENEEGWLSLSEQSHFIAKMYEFAYSLRKRSERATYVHGDINFRNIFFPADKIHVIDYSRIYIGEPGIDIAWVNGSLLGRYFLTGNTLYLELLNYFLKTYIELTQDEEAMTSQILALSFSVIIQTAPSIKAGFTPETARAFYTHVLHMLEEKKWIPIQV